MFALLLFCNELNLSITYVALSLRQELKFLEQAILEFVISKTQGYIKKQFHFIAFHQYFPLTGQ